MNTHTLPAFNLSGRIALVTGASKGMGRSIAAILAQAGARVVISSRNQADCDRVAAEIYQVRTNAIAPTAVRTDFSRVLWDTPDALARATARVPMGRIGEADDVAGLALLLASPAGSFINGQIIGVDGGASAW